MSLRRIVAAALLDVLVRTGDPYPAALTAAKSLATNPDALKPLEGFAAKGVPNANALSRELLTLVPKLSPPAQPDNATTGSGIVERLQAGASELVRIERTDTVGNDRGAVVARALGVTVVAAVLAWSILRGLWRTPQRIKRARRERRHARGRHAITHGLLAIGHGDSVAARLHADVARRHATHDPLALLLHAQSAQLDGDREGARAAFPAMAERGDTRLLGLRGLFIEAQRADDPVAAVMIAEEALKLAPASTWASHAVLGFRCAKADWSGALSVLDNNPSAGLIDKAAYRRQRGVLLTARALELETVDRDLSRESVMEAS